MITEETLKRWRKEALHLVTYDKSNEGMLGSKVELSARILRLTQELLDQHLLRK